jgi:FkbM family methyltransferase
MVSRLNKLDSRVEVAVGETVAGLRGDKLDAFRRDTASWLNRGFFKLAEALQAEFLIECGAHEAGASIKFVKEPGRRALAIEPNPYTFEHLTRRAERRGVTPLHVGLSDKQGRATFYVRQGAERAGNTSFLKRPSEVYDEIEVNLTTLDAVAAAHASDANSIALWVDVEGLTYQVLRGGSSLLRSPRCKLIKVEVETKPQWEGQKLAEQVDALLGEFGLTPVLQDIEYETQHNLIYVRSDSVGAIETIVETELATLSKIRPRFFPRPFKSIIHDAKTRLMSEDGPLFLHRAAAALGSASSAHIVKKRIREDRAPPPATRQD